MSSPASSSVCLLGAGPALAQTVAGPAKAKATTPEIPFDSVPNFFKLPPASTWAKASASPPTRRATCSSTSRSGETRLFEFDQNGAFVKEFGVGSYGFAFAHAVRVDKDDNVWAVDEGTNVIQKFSPDGKLLMVLGKRPDPLEQLVADAGRRPVLGRQPAVLVPPPDRRRLGSAGQHLRLRRLRRLARREVRQERPLHQVGRHARQRAAAVQHAARDRGRREGHRLCRRPRQLAHRRARQRPEPEGGLRQRRRAVGGLHLARARTSISTAPTRSRPATTSIRRRSPARSTRWSSTARCSAGSARPGMAFKEFSSIHQMDCRNPDELYVAEITAWRVQKIILQPRRPRDARAGQ